jgi:hypothetical protein
MVEALKAHFHLMSPLPVVVVCRSEQLADPPLLVPSGEWLTISDMVVYDGIAFLYYRWKGSA